MLDPADQRDPAQPYGHAGSHQTGEHACESDVIRGGLLAMSARERALDDWLQQQALPSHDAYLADPSRAIPLEEVRKTIGKRKG